MVLQIEHVPCFPFQLLLPGGEGTLQAVKAEFHRYKVCEQAVGAHTLELNHHIQFIVVTLRNKLQRFFRCNEGGFCNSDTVIVVKGLFAKLGKEFMQPWTEIVMEDTPHSGDTGVRQTLPLGNEGDHILAKSVDPHIQPIAQNLHNLLTYQRIVHIQVRLLDCKEMKIVFLPYVIPLPGFAFKHAVPVVWQFSVRTFWAPDIIVRIGLDFSA